MVKSAAVVFRDFETDGVPTSGKHKVQKADARQWGTYIESLANLAFSNGRVYANKATLAADLAPGPNVPALVIGDPTPGNDGLYQKVGAAAAGSWNQLTDFVPGAQIVHAVDAGAGTADAIIATSNIGLSSTGSQLVRLDVFRTNTGSPVTVSFNGGAALPVKTASGNDPVPGALTVGAVLGTISSGTFRLLSDLASAAVLAAAEAAVQAARDQVALATTQADRSTVAAVRSEAARDIAAGYASDAVSQGNVPIYSTRSGVPSLTIPVGIAAFRTNGYAAVGDGGDAFYKRVASQPSHAGKVQSADGAWWELVRGPTVDIRSFGAKADWNGTTGTDNQQAFADAVGFLGSDGGTIKLVGQFFKSATHLVETNVLFSGEGSSGLNSRPAAIIVPAGKTAFIYQAGAAGSPFPNSRSSGAGIGDIEISAAGKNAATTTGSIASGSRTLTLASAGDFENGQVIIVRGAGQLNVGTSHILGDPSYVTARTTAGSDVMVTSNAANASGAAGDGRFGVIAGMRVDVAGAGFPAGTYCISADSSGNCTMSQQAVNTVTGAAITYYDDLRAIITSGAGTTTLTLNCRAGGTVTDAVVEHYDCAVVSLTRVVTGRGWSVKGFNGAAFLIMGGTGILSSRGADANANCCVINYGNVDTTASAVVFQGTDANAGSVNNVAISGSTRYGFIDNSLLGNAFHSCHSAGFGGWMVPLLNPNTTIVGCYVEAGVPCTLGEHTLALGGTFAGVNPSKWGGLCIAGTTSAGMAVSGMRVGRTYGATSYTVDIAKSAYALQIDGSRLGGSAITQLRRSLSGEGQAGLYGWFAGSLTTSCAMFFSDTDHPSGAGQAYFVNGWNMGRKLTSLVTTNFRARLGTGGAPTSGAVARGDWFEDFNVAAGGNMFHVCTTAGVIGSTAVIKTGGAIAA